MAAEGDAKTEMKAHRSSYALFTSLFKWGTIISFIITAIVVLLIAT